MRDRAQRIDYLFVAISLLGLSSAIILVFHKPTPRGFWVNIYTYFAPSWFLIWGVAVSGILYTSHRSLRWSVVWVLSVMLVFAAGSIALVWGVPWPNHDPWNHLGFIRFGYFDPNLNPYPAFHILVSVLAELTELDPIHWVTVASAALPALAIGFVIALVRRLPLPATTAQPAIFALLPGIFLGFTPRPFTLAWILVPIGFFLVFQLSRNQIKTYRNLIIGFVVISPGFHPQLTGFLIVLLGAAWLASRLQGRLPIIEIVPRRPMVIHHRLLIFSGLVFLSYIIIYSDVGLSLIQRTVFAYLTESGPSEVTQARTGTGIFAFLESPQAAQEALTRLTYHLLLGGIVAIATIRELTHKHMSFEFATAWIASASMIFGFFLLFIFSSGLGIERVLRLTPIIAIPAVVLGFKQLPGRAVPIALAILCITAGLVTVYSSDFQGAAGISANKEQAAGAEWISDYNTGRKVIGSSSTYWMLKAYEPRPQLWDLKYQKPMPENIRYRWQIRGEPTLYVIDGTTEAILEQVVEETGRTQYVTEYNQLLEVREKIYTNGGLSVHQNRSGVRAR